MTNPRGSHLATVALLLLLSPARGAAEASRGDAADGGPLAGYRDDRAFLRDRGDNFRLYPGGKLFIDFDGYFGPGVTSTTLGDRIVLRRIEPTVSGEVAKLWYFTLGAAWESAAVARPGAGTTEVALRRAGRSVPPARGLVSVPADAFAGWAPFRLLAIQFGQFDVPFMLENRTSDAQTAFLERSLAARTLGVPENKALGAMFAVEPDARILRHELGVFLADGPNGDVNDGYDVASRLILRPFWFFPMAKELTVGASLRGGTRRAHGAFDPLPSFTTQGGFELWGPTYSGDGGLTNVLPADRRQAQAVEVHLPFTLLDFTFEWVHALEETREVLDGTTAALRTGTLTGSAYYLQLGFWIQGRADMFGARGFERPPHADLLQEDRPRPLKGAELLFRYEHLSARYESSDRTGRLDPQGIDGAIRTDAFAAGFNYWWTKHLRLTADYVFYSFPESRPPGQSTPAQRAIAPAQTISASAGGNARLTGHELHELAFRIAFAM